MILHDAPLEMQDANNNADWGNTDAGMDDDVLDDTGDNAI